MNRRLRAVAACLFLHFSSIGVFTPPAGAVDLKDTISNLYGPQGILLEPSTLPFFSQAARFQASSLQGLDQLNNQLVTSIGVPSFSSAVTGFRFDIERGIPVQTTESLGPLLTERATTLGAKKLDLAFTYTRVNFKKLDGKDLDNLELVFVRDDANGNGIRDLTGPFSFESDVIRASLKVDLTEDIFAIIATYGLTSRWDVGLVVPVIHIRLRASSQAAIFDQFGNPGGTTIGGVPVHRFGRNSNCDPAVDPPSSIANCGAHGGGDETGLGDVILRTKYNFLRDHDDVVPDMAVLVEVKLPTGDEERLLGTGGTNITGLLVASKTYREWLTPHVNLGYEIDTKDTRQSALRYALGCDVRLTPGLTLVGDVIGRFRPEAGETGEHITDLSLGAKWNPWKSLTLRANIQIPLDKNSGLRADFIPTVGVEYIF
ncbi:MAG: transporter [Candidatus Methylomirabilaceae bacterium]